MRTSELLVEPLLIGFAVLITAAFLGSPDLERWFLGASLENVAGPAVAAYLAGVVFDRLADTILGPLEHHHRLQFALRVRNFSGSDPFPEDTYHIRVMHNEVAWTHASYLRSRIRIIRALLVLTPALGVAVAVRTATATTLVRFLALSCVLWVYLIVGVNAARRRDPMTAARLNSSDASIGDPPRTDGPSDSDVRKWYQTKAGALSPLVAFVIRNEPASWSVLMLAGVAGAVGLAAGDLGLSLSLITGMLILTAVLTFCWWRITETFFVFVQNYARSGVDPSQR